MFKIARVGRKEGFHFLFFYFLSLVPPLPTYIHTYIRSRIYTFQTPTKAHSTAVRQFSPTFSHTYKHTA